jgi:hypothetical protein
MKYTEMSYRYHWECARRNKNYVKDWKKYFENSNLNELKRLLLKWGVASFPQSDNFELRYEEVPRQKEDEWSDFFIQNQKNHYAALKGIFHEAKKNFPLISLSHRIFTGAEDETRIDVPFDKEKNIYFLENEEGKKERVFYLTEYNSSGYKEEIYPLTEKNIPDDITLTLHNFKTLCRKKSNRTGFEENVARELNNQLTKWAIVTKELSIAEKDLRNPDDESLEDYLEVWDRFQKGELPHEIAKAKWPDAYERCTMAEADGPDKPILELSAKKKKRFAEAEAVLEKRMAKYEKEGLSPEEADEKVMKDGDKGSKKGMVLLIQNVKRCCERAQKYIDNPQEFINE